MIISYEYNIYCLHYINCILVAFFHGFFNNPKMSPKKCPLPEAVRLPKWAWLSWRKCLCGKIKRLAKLRPKASENGA